MIVDPRALGHIGRYQLLEPLGSSSMGSVYLARLGGHASFEKLFAVKILLPDLTRDRRFIDALAGQARGAGKLAHPNITEILELGEDDGRAFIVTPFLCGVPMTEILRLPPLDRATHAHFVASIIAQAADGLAYAHRHGVVHGELSPSSLFVTSDGAVKVLDFGVGKARGGDAAGSRLSYRSPEQVRRSPIDNRSDVFSLGVVLFEGLTSTRLFARNSDAQIAKAILEEDAEDPRARRDEVPQALANVALSALARDRERRMGSAGELAAALRSALSPAELLEPARIADELANRFGAVLERERARVTRTGSGIVGGSDGEAREAPTQRRSIGAIAVLVGIALAVAIAGAAYYQFRAAKEDSGEAAEIGTLSVDSTPYATIYIDGQRIGTTPIARHAVAPGRRKVVAVLPSGRKQELWIDVAAGKDAKVESLRW